MIVSTDFCVHQGVSKLDHLRRMELRLGRSHRSERRRRLLQRRACRACYRDLVNGHFTETTADDTEIEQDVRRFAWCRSPPSSASCPFGSPSSFQPYVGAGVAVDSVPLQRSRRLRRHDRRHGVSGATTSKPARPSGPSSRLAFGSRIKGDIYALTTEWRYQWATGDITGVDEYGQPKFLTDKIDLGGGNLNFGFLIRF